MDLTNETPSKPLALTKKKLAGLKRKSNFNSQGAISTSMSVVSDDVLMDDLQAMDISHEPIHETMHPAPPCKITLLCDVGSLDPPSSFNTV